MVSEHTMVTRSQIKHQSSKDNNTSNCHEMTRTDFIRILQKKGDPLKVKKDTAINKTNKTKKTKKTRKTDEATTKPFENGNL